MRTVLDAYTSPRRHEPTPATTGNTDATDPAGSATDDADSTGQGVLVGVGEPEGVEVGVDGRSMDQKAFDALASLFAAHAASGGAPSSHGAAPTLLVTATLPALHAFLKNAQMSDGVALPNPTPGLVLVSEAKQIPASPLDPLPVGEGVDAFAGLRSWGQGWEQAPETPPPVDLAEPPEPRPVLGVGVDPAVVLEGRFARVARSDAVVPVSRVVSMLCADDVQFMLTDEVGLPLRLGRARRHFSVHQRRALMVRDRMCRAPGCGAPPGWCEAHHVIAWGEGGPTDVDHAVLLCNFHHHEVHLGRLVVEPTPTPRAVAGSGVQGGVRPWTVLSTWITRHRPQRN